MLSNIGNILFHQSPRLLINQPIRKIATQSSYWIRPLSQRLLLSTISIYFYTKLMSSRTLKCDEPFKATAENSTVMANRRK